MLIGAHVSTAGGLCKAVERGTEFGCKAIQIFNQSPRMWRPTVYSSADFAGFREAISTSALEAVVIHAIYLISPASTDKEMHKKGLDSLIHALRVGDEIDAIGVVLHPGHVKEEDYDSTIARVVTMVRDALAESDHCHILLENAAGKKAVGAKFEHLADLIDGLGGDQRVGVCIDSCHAHAAGYDVRSFEAVASTIDTFDSVVGLDRLSCVHLNDSRDEIGSHRDRHENLGEGFVGSEGISAFLSEPRLEKLPVLMEVPGLEKSGPGKADVDLAFKLRKTGLKARDKAAAKK